MGEDNMRITVQELEDMKRKEPLHKTMELHATRGLPQKRTHEFNKYIVHEVTDWNGNKIYDKHVRHEK